MKCAVVVVYYCRTYMKAVRGGGVKRGDVCYGMLRAAACVDESDHHALMYVRQRARRMAKRRGARVEE